MSFFSHSLREGGVSLCVVKNSSSQVFFSLLHSESRATAFLLFSSCTLLAFSVPPPFTHRSHIAHTSLTHRSHICTHLALILHSSVTHRKKKNEEEKYSPHTPYKKKKIKEEENPIFFLTSEYWGARDIFQRISAKAKGLFS